VGVSGPRGSRKHREVRGIRPGCSPGGHTQTCTHSRTHARKDRGLRVEHGRRARLPWPPVAASYSPRGPNGRHESRGPARSRRSRRRRGLLRARRRRRGPTRDGRRRRAVGRGGAGGEVLVGEVVEGYGGGGGPGGGGGDVGRGDAAGVRRRRAKCGDGRGWGVSERMGGGRGRRRHVGRWNVRRRNVWRQVMAGRVCRRGFLMGRGIRRRCWDGCRRRLSFRGRRRRCCCSSSSSCCCCCFCCCCFSCCCRCFRRFDLFLAPQSPALLLLLQAFRNRSVDELEPICNIHTYEKLNLCCRHTCNSLDSRRARSVWSASSRI
jgi:hypothetical protein